MIPRYTGAAMGAIALVTLSSSITPSSIANMTRAGARAPLDDTPTAIDVEPW